MGKSYHGLATGVGSFPSQEPEEALEIIFDRVPLIPHWPQLPQKDATESMVRQYLTPLLQKGLVKEDAEGTPYFTVDTAAGEEYLRNFMTNFPLAEDQINAYAFPAETAAGFYAFAQALEDRPRPRYLKGQITGPLTMGLTVYDLNGKPAFYNKVFRKILTLTLALQVRWQIRYFRRFNLPFILFIDEPGLYLVGKKDHTSFTRQDVADSLRHLLSVAQEEGAEVGVHTCAGTDWTFLFALPFDIVNLDIYHFFSTLLPFAVELDSFLARGGTLAWGLIPTSREVQEHTAESLAALMRNYQEQLIQAGVEAKRLKRQYLLTPSCGAGTLTAQEVRRVYRLLQEVSSKILTGEL